MSQTWEHCLRPLPIQRAPMRDELLSSYIRRLAHANALPPRSLLTLLGRGGTYPKSTFFIVPQGLSTPMPDTDDLRPMITQIKGLHEILWRRTHKRIMFKHENHRIVLREPHTGKPPWRTTSRDPDDAMFDHDLALNEPALHRLSVLSTRSPDQLRRFLSLPESRYLDDEQPRWNFTKRTARDPMPACHHCAQARHHGDEILLDLTPATQICRKHRRWVGHLHPTGHPTISTLNFAQHPLHALPELIKAAEHLNTLINRDGPRASKAFSSASFGIRTWIDSPHGETLDRWKDRIARLNRRRRVAAHALIELVCYPEAVAWADMVLNPRWHAALTRRPPNQQHVWVKDEGRWTSFPLDIYLNNHRRPNLPHHLSKLDTLTITHTRPNRLDHANELHRRTGIRHQPAGHLPIDMLGDPPPLPSRSPDTGRNVVASYTRNPHPPEA